MRRASLAVALTLAILLSGCTTLGGSRQQMLPPEGSPPFSNTSILPDIQNFPPKNFTGPLNEAKSLVEKSYIPLPRENASVVPASSPSIQQEANEDGTAIKSSTEPGKNATATAVPPVLAANNSSTPVTMPSNESAEELPTEISIANPGMLQVYYYYSTYCPYSMRIKPFMDRQQVRFENVTEWHTFDVSTRQGYYFFDKMALERNLSNASRVVPFAIVNSATFIGIGEINQSFALTIIKATR